MDTVPGLAAGRWCADARGARAPSYGGRAEGVVAVHRRRIVALLAACAALVALSPPASAGTAAPGSPVTAFGGGDGTVLVPVLAPPWPGVSARSQRVGLIDAQRTGAAAGSFRLYMAASWEDAGFLLIKHYLPDGRVDMSWNGGRARWLYWNAPDEVPYPLALDSARRVYVAVGGLEGGVELRRLTWAGVWDTAYTAAHFGSGDFGNPGVVSVAPSGRAWICQSAQAGSTARLAVGGFDPSGAQDVDGVIDLSAWTDRAQCRHGVAAADGSLLLVVYLFEGAGAGVPVLVRVGPGGALDTSFGADGVAALPTGFTADWGGGGGVFLHGTGVVASGITTVAGATRPTLARLTAAGALDARFGYGGMLRLAHPSTVVASVDPDGLGGLFVSLQASGPQPDPGLLHLTAAGRPVVAFGSGGYLRLGTSTVFPGGGPSTVVVFASGRMLVGVTARRATTWGLIPASRVDKRWAW